MYSRKSLGPRIRALRDSSINWIFLWRLPIHKYMKHFISKKRGNKAKYLTWNYTRLNFVKKTSMQNAVKSLQYIKWSFVKSPCNSTRYNCQEISSWLRRPKFMLEIKKKARFIYVINNPIIYKFFKDFTNQRKKTNRAAVFSCRPFPNIL